MLNLRKQIIKSLVVLSFIALSGYAYSGLPFNNLEGVGGAAFNPFAYTAGLPWVDSKDSTDQGFKQYISKPQIGSWYVNLGKIGGDWTSFSVSETFFKRLEVSYGHEIVALNGAKTIKKDSFGTKLQLISENQFDTQWVPAVAVGGIFKRTTGATSVVPSSKDSGSDFYLVATKLITQTPKPLLVSGGVLSTDARTTGVLGYDSKRKVTAFGNADVVLNEKFAVGAEYKQGARFPTFKNANYYDAHLIFFPTKDLSLILAYVNGGNEKSKSTVGVGEGFVLSAQYQF